MDEEAKSGGGGQPQQVAGSSSQALENIKVAVRLRPFTERERQRNSRRIVDIEHNTVALHNPKQQQDNWKRFTFDHSYWSHDGFRRDADGVNVKDLEHPNGPKYVGQEEVFADLGQFLLKNALEGYNSALLAYGQTGSGKSYTVSGYGHNEGILPRLARALFQELDSRVGSQEIQRYEVYFSMMEIYNEVVRDLLAKSAEAPLNSRRGLKVREHPKRGFFVEHLSSHRCGERKEIERLIEEGQLNKSIAATSMNEASSRGHTIYEFRIRQFRSSSPQKQDELATSSMVQLVDLAGSERLAVHVSGGLGGDSFIGGRSSSPYATKGAADGGERPASKASSIHGSSRPARAPKSSGSASSMSSTATAAAGQNDTHHRRFRESVSINQSLSALGNCIQVMSQYSQQQQQQQPLKIPYRDSVLTKLLNRCCLSGNSKVVIIATLSPVDANYDDTLSTLRFADRAKQIKTHAIINRNELAAAAAQRRQLTTEGGRITRSDDSSQTSNFDENESAVENFAGPSKLDTMASPLRSRTTVRRAGGGGKPVRASSSSSAHQKQPALLVREQMKRLVSPARQKMLQAPSSRMRKSRSQGQGLADDADRNEDEEEEEDDDDDELELEMRDMKDEGLLSPESEDSATNQDLAAGDDLAGDENSANNMSSSEQIGLVNRMLSSSLAGGRGQQPVQPSGDSKLPRPKRGAHRQARGRVDLKEVAELSSSLKKAHPYLSNLNMDEQLTGMISYIIKEGETELGKAADCDVVLRGTELRPRHARIIRELKPEQLVYLEPILDASATKMEDDKDKRVALKLNGAPVLERSRLQHGDRLLFGTNSYYVYVDNVNLARGEPDPLSVTTFDAARNEVLEKMMAEEKNEAMLKEIKDYTHRPGTGKGARARSKPTTEAVKNNKVTATRRAPPARPGASRLARSMSIHTGNMDTTTAAADVGGAVASSESQVDKLEVAIEPTTEAQEASKEEDYRDQLMADTYEYAIPVAEVVAVAKEMGIRVTYELKILTGEEQLPTGHNQPPAFGYAESSVSDNLSSSSKTGGNTASDSLKSGPLESAADNVTYLDKLDGLDLAPAVFVRVHLEELGLDFHWSKEKFQARRFKILELYAAWEMGGKAGLVEHLIDRSRHSTDYQVDPFIDPPTSTPVLIGHSQIVLQPVSHLADIKQSYDLLDLNDQLVGSISVIAVPCHTTPMNDNPLEPYREFSPEELERNLLSSPSELLGKRLVFKLKLVSFNNLPPNKYTNVYCQYTLNPSQAGGRIRTRTVLQEGVDKAEEEQAAELPIDHSHYICFNQVTQDILDFLQDGFLTLQVVGQYRVADKQARSPTLVTTIINSINKYKYKLEQQSNNSGYSGLNNFNNSQSGSAFSNRSGPQLTQDGSGGPSSVASTSATVGNLYDQQNDEDEPGLSQENIIDMILTKRKLDRAENQLSTRVAPPRTKIQLAQSNKMRPTKQTARKSTAHTQENPHVTLPKPDDKPDPLVNKNLRLKVRINQRYEARLTQPKPPVGRGKSRHALKRLERLHKIKQLKHDDRYRLQRLRAEQRLLESKPSIPMLPFTRIVREIMRHVEEEKGLNHTKSIQQAALEALREATEGFMVNMFEHCSLYIHHAGRVTLMVKDLALAKRIFEGRIRV